MIDFIDKHYIQNDDVKKNKCYVNFKRTSLSAGIPPLCYNVQPFLIFGECSIVNAGRHRIFRNPYEKDRGKIGEYYLNTLLTTCHIVREIDRQINIFISTRSHAFFSYIELLSQKAVYCLIYIQQVILWYIVIIKIRCY